MTFRVRVVLLAVVVALLATVTTALLIVHEADRQFTEIAVADRSQTEKLAEGLVAYARGHGTWDGVAQAVRDMSQRTGQRLRVTTARGALLADSDLLIGTQARPLTGPATVVDPRLSVQLPVPSGSSWLSAVQYAWSVVVFYDVNVRYAICLTGAGVPVQATTASAGRSAVPAYLAVGGADPTTIDRCQTRSHTETSSLEMANRDLRDGVLKGLPAQFQSDVRKCQPLTGTGLVACVQQAFSRQISVLGPQPVQFYLGAVDEQAPELDEGPIYLVATAIVAVIFLLAWLVSRRVLRPIGALTDASRGLGAGRLDARVRIKGRDELAELGRTFNRMADSLQASEEQQRRMVADVAHELRTPLANLRGYLEALKDGVLSPSPELFASLHEESLLQQRIVDDLQELALAEAGALRYHWTPVNLAELAQTCRLAAAQLVEGAGLTLAVDAPEPARVQGDPDRLRQVVSNLIRNAVAATPRDGCITLRVHTGQADLALDGESATSMPCAYLDVIDTGIGIDVEHVPHVFDRFWRADRSRGRTPGGGLGLAITRQIVTDHRGTIGVASELNKGTTFTITLPLREPDSEAN